MAILQIPYDCANEVLSAAPTHRTGLGVCPLLSPKLHGTETLPAHLGLTYFLEMSAFCSVGYFTHTHTTTTTTMNLPTNSEWPALIPDLLYAQPSPSHIQGFHKCAQKHQLTCSSLVFHLPPSTCSRSRSWGEATL